MAQRIISVSAEPFDRAIETVGLRMLRCALHRNGERCMHALCPKDQIRPSKRNYRTVTKLIASVPKAMRTSMITITIGVDSIKEGHALFVDLFARLRRRKSFGTIVAGFGQMEVLATGGKERRWNLHAHVLVMHAPRPDVRAMRADWKSLTAKHGLPASLWWTCIPQTRRHVQTDRGLFSPVGSYVTKRRRAKDWLEATTDEELRELVRHYGGRRWMVRFGSWTRNAGA
jgi:hypothetical protein